jgi:uncharacterized iron-regulated membrane protein
VIFFLAFTGCILTYQRQIVAWQEHGYHSQPRSANASDLPVDQVVEKAHSVEGIRPTAVSVWADPAKPVEVDFGRDQRLFLDRYTGAVLGRGAVRTRAFFDTVTALHRWFGAPPKDRPLARMVKGGFDLALLLMILTGAALWWPKTWSWTRFKAGAFFRAGLSGKAWNWNRHNTLGLWAAQPLIVITVTGAILTYGWATNLLYRAAGSSPPLRVASKGNVSGDKKHSSREAKPQAAVNISQILASAEHQATGWRILKVPLPKPADRSVTVNVDFLDSYRPDQRAEIVFNRESGGVERLDTFSSYSLGKRLHLFVHTVHTGEAGGMLGETVSGLAGLACCALVWTGISLAFRRLRIAQQSAVRDSSTSLSRPQA